ncbi:MAG: hypothetical protein KUL82_06970 [Bdellovibrio sp.]|uniref:hypothetical protein n=1 Tax=Bdellovibrio sp. TaxID=28201 RepID=UPI0039E4C69F|nr:hypothetical protein [Bdellovibrio sp.]
MYSELGVFALKQVLASMAVVGPILILIGLCFYIFKQDRRSIVLYLTAGVFFTLIGAVCLYTEFKTEQRPALERQVEEESPVVESTRI